MLKAQERRFQLYDSLTLKYYYAGDWARLREEGRRAIADGIDYKYLRQRLGHAEFIRENYYAGLSHLEKAYHFDSYDHFTLEYLYYSYLNTGKELYAGPILKKMSPEEKKSLAVKPAGVVRSVEAEYCYKFNTSNLRSDPNYLRAAFTSALGLRLDIYQSFSVYRQVMNINISGLDSRVRVSESGSLTRMSYTLSRHMLLRAGYHFIATSFGNERWGSNLFLISAEPDFNRFNLQGSLSAFKTPAETTWQTGLHARYVFPGKSAFYLASGLAVLQSTGRQDLIFNASTGLKPGRKIWIEGSLASGEMQGYNEFNGLYVYNTYDPMVFRAGGSILYYAGKKFTLWFSYSLERRRYGDISTSYYNQFSNLGGIKWKI